MIRTLIVDDETLVRATLRTLVDWEALGYTIVQDCADGGQALEYLKDHPVDVLFTDMKMPSVGGIELLRSLRETPDAPVSIALSGYDEFELVREAFRLGAYDYLLKANLNADTLRALLEQLKEKFFRETAAQKQPEDAAEAFFRAEAGQYAVVLFQIDDFAAQASRFGSNLHEKLERPMLELARQIPRLAGRTCIRAVSPERYALRYRVQDASRFETTLPSVVRQVQAVWRDYMNLSVSAAISGLVRENELPAAEETCEKLLRMAPLSGKGAVCTLRREMAAAQAAEQLGKSCDLLIESVCTGNTAQAETEKTEFLHYAAVQPDPNAVLLALLARLAERLGDYGQNFREICPEKPDLAAEIRELHTAGERALWLRSFLRRVETVCARQAACPGADSIQKAVAFLQDNYANPELCLKMVADYVALNEKYFRTRFAKECGSSFIVYLNDLRLYHARELLMQTDLKMYEISDRVGYSSVEHFNHIFKKKFGKTPSEYRKAACNT